MTFDTQHPFDQAISLQNESTGEGRYVGASHPAWANRVGPFGGITAAAILNAVMLHPKRLGEPVAITVNFCATVQDGAYGVQAIPVRTNRSTQHWTIALTQNGETVITAAAVTAVRRESWSAQGGPMPTVSLPESYPLMVGHVDFLSLAGLCDVFFPRIYLRQYFLCKCAASHHRTCASSY